jgi:tetratricopeptide (TPR) repeat protein
VSWLARILYSERLWRFENCECEAKQKAAIMRDLVRALKFVSIGFLAISSIQAHTNEPQAPGQDVQVPRKTGGESKEVPALTAEPGKTFALVLGISNYREPSIPPLSFSVKDAELFRDYLRSKRGGGLVDCKDQPRSNASESCFWLLTDQKATSEAVRVYFNDLAERAAENKATLVMFSASHGFMPCVANDSGVENTGAKPDCSGKTTDRETYLLTYDSMPEDARMMGFPFTELTALVVKQTYRFRRILVYLDVCHAGVMPWLAEDVTPAPEAVAGGVKDAKGSVGYLLASSRKSQNRKLEYAYESSNLQHGVFSYFLLNGVSGAVNPRANSGVFLGDVATYVTEQVRNATGGKQTPFQEATDEIVVVDNYGQRDFSVPKAAETAPKLVDRKPRALDWPIQQDRSDTITSAPRAPSGETDARREREIALADAGNRVLFEYLRGDQVPQTKEDFVRGGQAFEEALALNPNYKFHESRMLFCKGRAALFTEDGFDKAMPLLERAIQLDPKGAYAYNAIGIAYLERLARSSRSRTASVPQTGDGDKAIAALKDAILRAPYWAYPRHNLALTYAQLGKYDLAIETYEEAKKIRPDYSYLPFNLGLLYQKLDEKEKANNEFRLALRLAEHYRKRLVNPPKAWTERAAVSSAMGTLAFAEGRRRKAEGLYDKALADDPQYAPAIHNKAQARMAAKDWAGAANLYRDALAIEPGFTASRLGLAEALTKQGNADGAAAEYDTIITAIPDYVAAYREKALLLAAKGDLPAAMQELDLALGKQPDSAQLKAEKEDVESLMQGRPPKTASYRAAEKARKRS